MHDTALLALAKEEQRSIVGKLGKMGAEYGFIINEEKKYMTIKNIAIWL